ncbi:MAG: isochorismatase family protein [Pseudomonadota bacterium]
MNAGLMDVQRSTLLVIDVQERLLPAMDGQKVLEGACAFLCAVATECAVPVIISEQYPKGLGATVPAISEAAGNAKIIAKTAFSAAAEPKILDRLRKLRSDKRRDQIVVCGIEAHVCVLQSALELRAAGFDVFVAADAVSSRRIGSRDLALSRLGHAGIGLVSTEMVAFEWIGDAKSKHFKPISAMVRDR